MKYNELLKYNSLLKYQISELQIELDNLAFDVLKEYDIIQSLVIVQSICTFNIFWAYSISPDIFLHKKTVIFIEKYIKKFSRKINIKELILFDLIINRNNFNNFNDFKNEFTNKKNHSPG